MVSEYKPSGQAVGCKLGSGQENPAGHETQCVPLENSPREQREGGSVGFVQDWPTGQDRQLAEAGGEYCGGEEVPP